MPETIEIDVFDKHQYLRECREVATWRELPAVANAGRAG